MRNQIIPLFIPHYGCPQQCIFCDQRTITAVDHPVDEKDVKAIIHEGLTRINRPHDVEIAFYGGSFTALPVKEQVKLLTPAKAALDQGEINRIRISTRPDAIDVETARRLIAYGVSTVELGVQSMDDRVLAASNRGHMAADTFKATAILKDHHLMCGIQLMPGLPGEDWPSLIHTANTTLFLKPDFVRIYPTVVIAGTPLEVMYRQDRYQPLSLKAAVSRAAYLKLLFGQHKIPVIRYGLQATELLSTVGTVVAGPYHPAFGEMVASFIFNLMISRFLGNIYTKFPDTLSIHHHPKDQSKLRGIANANLINWQKKYYGVDFYLIPDWPYLGELGIDCFDSTYIINEFMLLDC